MKKNFIQTRLFSRVLDELIQKKKISEKSYQELEAQLIEDPQVGDVIQGCGGLRKMRLGSTGKGKSGSCRVIYLDVPSAEKIYLIALYEKSFKEDLSNQEKKELKNLVEVLKKEAKHG